MNNAGIAPIYQQYSIELSIVDEDGSEIWVSEDIDLDLRSLLPNEVKSFSCVANKGDFDDDATYRLLISIKDDEEKAVVPMALLNEVEANCYQIASFSVK